MLIKIQKIFPIILIFIISVSLTNCGGGNDSQSSSDIEPTTKPIVELISSVAESQNFFGYPLDFSPDGNTIAIGELNGGNTPNRMNDGAVQIFKKSAAGWDLVQYIPPESPNSASYFSFIIKFSPDGSLLAIGQKFANIDIGGGVFENKSLIQLYTQINSKWVYSQSVTLEAPYQNDYLSSSIAFSPDSQRLALSSGGSRGNGGRLNRVVQIFNRTNSVWSWSQTILPEDLASNSFFGYNLLFSPDGSILAVSEFDNQLNNVKSSIVHLYQNTNNMWSKTQLLTSDTPSVANYLIKSGMAFSSNSQSLYIGEPNADLDSLTNSGKVRVFNKIENLWTPVQVILPQSPAINFGFGLSIAISADDKIMAVGEYSTDTQGAVQIYKRTGNNWQYFTTLSPAKPNSSGFFGSKLTFSPVSSELAISESGQNRLNLKYVGAVTIIDISQIQ